MYLPLQKVVEVGLKKIIKLFLPREVLFVQSVAGGKITRTV